VNGGRAARGQRTGKSDFSGKRNVFQVPALEIRRPPAPLARGLHIPFGTSGGFRTARRESVQCLCFVSVAIGRHGLVLPFLPFPTFPEEKVHFMRFKNSYAAAVAAAVSAVVFSAAFQPAEASFIFYAEQVGPNVVITGSGSFITSGSVGPGGAIPFSTNTFFPLAASVAADFVTTGSFVAAPTAVYAPLFSRSIGDFCG
jgi:hypothetical protein